MTLRFNRVFPGFLIASALIGTIALGSSAVSYHIEDGRLWTATWVGISYLFIGAVLLASARRLAVREDPPDCKPLYLASGGAVAVLAVAGFLAYLFPVATAKAPLAMLNLLAPNIGQELDRFEKAHGEVLKRMP